MRRNAEALEREAALQNRASFPTDVGAEPPPRPPPPTAPFEPIAQQPHSQPQAEPIVETGLQQTFEVQWNQLDEARRDLLAEWSRLSKARERIESLYEHLDGLREQLDLEHRQLVVQRERVWVDRFQPASLPERPWRDAAAHMLEAAVIVRAAVAQRAPELMARLRGRAARGSALIVRRKELPPGSSS
jgi:hypothetical protein